MADPIPTGKVTSSVPVAMTNASGGAVSFDNPALAKLGTTAEKMTAAASLAVEGVESALTGIGGIFAAITKAQQSAGVEHPGIQLATLGMGGQVAAALTESGPATTAQGPAASSKGGPSVA